MEHRRVRRFFKKFLDKLGIKKCVLMGHSFGGSVAIYFTVENPQKIKKLVLVASSGIRNRNFFKKTKLITFMIVAKIIKIIFIIVPQRFSQSIKKKAYELLGSEDYLTDNNMKEIYKKVIQRDLQMEMQKINCPTILICGKKDKSTPINEAYQTQKNIKNSKLRIIKNAGHYPFLDNVRKWNDVIMESINN